MSEGEQQLLTVLGLLLFTQNDESLYLLDEPDTHLNPVWTYDFLKLLQDNIRAEKGQLIVATHNPLMIGSLHRNQVRVLGVGASTADKAPCSSFGLPAPVQSHASTPASSARRRRDPDRVAPRSQPILPTPSSPGHHGKGVHGRYFTPNTFRAARQAHVGAARVLARVNVGDDAFCIRGDLRFAEDLNRVRRRHDHLLSPGNADAEAGRPGNSNSRGGPYCAKTASPGWSMKRESMVVSAAAVVAHPETIAMLAASVGIQVERTDVLLSFGVERVQAE